jgi:hypothetical protein
VKRRPERGDRYVWSHADRPAEPVFIQITRVARDGSWADLVCYTWAASWRKRQPLPLPARTERRAWGQDDLDAAAAAYERRWSAPLCEAGIHEADGSCCAVTTAVGGAEGDQSNGSGGSDG